MSPLLNKWHNETKDRKGLGSTFSLKSLFGFPSWTRPHHHPLRWPFCHMAPLQIGTWGRDLYQSLIQTTWSFLHLIKRLEGYVVGFLLTPLGFAMLPIIMYDNLWYLLRHPIHHDHYDMPLFMRSNDLVCQYTFEWEPSMLMKVYNQFISKSGCYESIKEMLELRGILNQRLACNTTNIYPPISWEKKSSFCYKGKSWS